MSDGDPPIGEPPHRRDDPGRAEARGWRGLLGRLRARTQLQRVVENTGWLFADRMVRLGVGLVVGVAVARYLGPARFGALNYAVSFVALFSVLATLGLEGIVVRDLVRSSSRRGEVMGTALGLRVAGGLVVLTLSVLSIWALRPDDELTRWLVVLVAATTVFQAADVVDFWFQSQLQSKHTVSARMVAFLLTSAVRIGLIALHAPLLAFAAAMLMEAVLATVALLVVYGRVHPEGDRWRWNPAVVRRFLRESWPVMLSGVAVLVQARIDQVMLGELLGAESVGQYSVAMRTVEFFGFIPMIIHSSVAPTVTAAKQRGDAAYRERLLNIYRLMFILSIGTGVPLYFFADRIILFLYGVEYAAAGALLGLMSLRLLLANFGVAKALFIINDGLFRFSLFSAVAGAVVNLGANYLLIPRLGPVGAVWSGIASFTVTVFIADLCFGKVRRNLRLMLLAMLTPWRFRLY